MKLDDISAGQRVFLDANIFVYHFTGRSTACRRLLDRCEMGEVRGLSGAHVVLEVLHRLMMLEAVQKGLVAAGSVAKKLREKPEVVSILDAYQELAARIPAMGVEVLPLDFDLVLASRGARRRFGLLALNSITVAMMERAAVSAIATLDRDFSRVASLEVFAPDLV